MTEGQPTQAQALTLITPIKQGFVETPRREGHADTTSPRGCLRYAERIKVMLGEIREIPQKDNGIDKLGSIHFARWVLIDDEQQLLFTSNFIGDLDQYLLDFSITLSNWVDRIWENCDGYPDRGARDFDRFRRWVRDHQVTEAYTYAANPAVTVADVRWHQAFYRLYQELVRNAQAEPHRLAEMFAEFQRKAHDIGLPPASPAPRADHAAETPCPRPSTRTLPPAPRAPADVPAPWWSMFPQTELVAASYESPAP
jgi:hypothetical protein